MNSNLDYLRKYAPITVNIQGEVSFSHITRMYEGEELIAANKRAQEHGVQARCQSSLFTSGEDL